MSDALPFETAESPPETHVVAWLGVALLSLVWGSTFVAIRAVLPFVPPFLLTGMRFVCGGSILMLLCILRGESLPRNPRAWLDQAINGFLMVSLANNALVWASHWLTAGMTALFAAMIPLWMAALESLVGSARMTLRRAAGLGLGFAGVALLVAPALGHPRSNLGFLLGALLAQVSSICWCVGSMRSRRHSIGGGLLGTAAIQTLSGGLVMLVVGAVAGDFARVRLTPSAIGSFLYLTLFGTVIGYAVYQYALTRLQAGKVALYAYVNPAVAVVVGAILLHEPVTLRMFAAMAVILTGVTVAGKAA